jgi:hypothetical protein
MDSTTLKDATAICGIDCFNCEFFHTNIDQYFATMPPERQQAYAARGMTLEKLRCHGCRNGGCTVIGGDCETLHCADAREVEFCYECDQFPCRRLQPLAAGGEKYPHNLKVYNLTAIKNRGLEAWAAEVGEIRKRYFTGGFKIGAGPQLPEKA